MEQQLKEKIMLAPDLPGVYIMRDALGEVLYVGKANSLKKRLRSYLSRDLSSKTIALMDKVNDVEFELSASESMALLLEASRIHEFKPKYNISLKDDKSFPLVWISADKFPSISVVRKRKYGQGKYLGPYTNAKLLRNALKIIRNNFAFRSCANLPKKSCIYYRINLCPAPCAGKISVSQYKRTLNNIIMILEGKISLLSDKLTKLMHQKSKERDFEQAAVLRDQIIVLSEMRAAQNNASRKNQMEDLREGLGMEDLPQRIEGFDISNLSGRQAVGSMVSFYNGYPDKKNYRRFRIKNCEGINDYKMLAEVLMRRYSRLIREKKALPDLLLIDGGKQHLMTAIGVLKQLDIYVPVASIAKERENIYTAKKLSLADISKDSPAMNLIRSVRDEAHRFALSYHHILRRKDLLGK